MVVLINVMVQLDIHLEKSESDSYLMSHMKIKSRWVVYLSVKGKAVKLTGNNKGDIFKILE